MYASLYWSAEFSTTLHTVLEQSAFDIVQCEFSYMGGYAPRRPRYDRAKWLLDAHNIEHRLNETLSRTSEGLAGLAYRIYADREARLRRREELEACLRVDRVVTVSAIDREILLREAPGLEVDIVPNGVDLDWFDTSGGSESARRPSAVFVGKMDYRPNVDAVRWFCREILPLVKSRVPAFVFTICGNDPVESVLALGKIEGVVVTGRVPDTRPYLEDAAVAVVPLRAGSGTRLKVLEAMAMGRPVVSTPIGAEGLDVVSGEDFAEADSPNEFAARIIDLLDNPDERERLGRAGRDLVEASYGWPAVVARLERVYEELLSTSEAELAR
jgi:glycosyltransferase involved in cell wall biosynthesis